MLVRDSVKKKSIQKQIKERAFIFNNCNSAAHVTVDVINYCKAAILNLLVKLHIEYEVNITIYDTSRWITRVTLEVNIWFGRSGN